MAKGTILVIEDEEDILELVRYNLERNGYRVLGAETGEKGLELARINLPELIVLDIMLPGMDGLEICKTLSAETRTASIPIIMLTAKSEEADMVAGLELGADDYVTKPFSPRVLLARIKAVLRRKKDDQGQGCPDVIRVHNLTIDSRRHQVLVDGREVALTVTEFKVLQLLAGRPGWVFSRYQIVDLVHGEDYAVTDRSVDVQIVGLRKKLGPAGSYIQTVRGVGYRFRE